jgi:hypothetical protein
LPKRRTRGSGPGTANNNAGNPDNTGGSWRGTGKVAAIGRPFRPPPISSLLDQLHELLIAFSDITAPRQSMRSQLIEEKITTRADEVSEGEVEVEGEAIITATSRITREAAP